MPSLDSNSTTGRGVHSFVCVFPDLRKRFEREPINTVVEVESTAQLQCLPPIGLPAPEVRSIVRLSSGLVWINTVDWLLD